MDLPGTLVPDDCKQLCGFWESNPDHLEEKPVLLTAESSLQPQEGQMMFYLFLIIVFVIPTFGRARQDDLDFKASLD